MIGADAGRLLGAALVPAAWLVAGWPAAAAMFLVFGAQWLLRWLAGGSPLDHLGQAVLLSSGWFSAIGAYHRLSWLDAVMHALATLVVALLVGRLLDVAAGPAAAGPAGARPGPRWWVVLAVAGTATTLGVLWEIAEWFGHTYITPEIGVGYDDTVGDLAANAVGAVAGAWLATRTGAGRRAVGSADGRPRAPADAGNRTDAGNRADAGRDAP